MVGVDVVVSIVGVAEFEDVAVVVGTDLNRAARDASVSSFSKYSLILAAVGTWKGGSSMFSGMGRLRWLAPTLSTSWMSSIPTITLSALPILLSP